VAIKITIIGMNPLGQSLALALKRSRTKSELNIVGHDRKRDRMREAKQAQVAHHIDWNLLNAVEAASLVIINEPLHEIRETLELIAPELQTEAVVTDTCHDKTQIIQWATALLPNHVHYIASTPLVQANTVSATLFQKQRYALIPQASTPPAAVALLSNAIQLIGAEPLFMDVAEHDSFMAAVVQLPVITSVALLNLATKGQAWREMAIMANNTFNHATALPSSDPKTLTTLLRYSSEPLLTRFKALHEELNTLQTLISKKDEGEALEAHLTSLMEAQQRWRKAQKQAPYDESLAQQMDEIKEANTFMSLLFGGGRRRGKR